MKIFTTLPLVVSLLASSLSFAVSNGNDLTNAIEVDVCWQKFPIDDVPFGRGPVICLLRSSNLTSSNENRSKCNFTLINWENLSNDTFELTVQPPNAANRAITCNSSDSCKLELNRPSTASVVLLGVSRLCNPSVDLSSSIEANSIESSTGLNSTTPRIYSETEELPEQTTCNLTTINSQRNNSSIDPITKNSFVPKCKYGSVTGTLPDGKITFFCHLMSSNFKSSDKNRSECNLTSSNFTSSDGNRSECNLTSSNFTSRGAKRVKCKFISTDWVKLSEGYLFTVQALNATSGGTSRNSSDSCTLEFDRPSKASVVLLGASRVYNSLEYFRKISSANTAKPESKRKRPRGGPRTTKPPKPPTYDPKFPKPPNSTPRSPIPYPTTNWPSSRRPTKSPWPPTSRPTTRKKPTKSTGRPQTRKPPKRTRSPFGRRP